MQYNFVTEFPISFYEKFHNGHTKLWISKHITPCEENTFRKFIDVSALLCDKKLMEMCYPELKEMFQSLERLFSDGLLQYDQLYYINDDGSWS